MTKETLTRNELTRLLSYDPDKGVFTNNVKRNSRRAAPGSVCGSLTTDGYVSIQIANKKYQAHRLAWLYMTGDWPKNELDHINRDRSDNRWANLREVSRIENSWNTGPQRRNTSGHKGVTWHRRNKKWQVQMRVKKQTHYIGQFDSLEDAVLARKTAELRLYEV